MTPVLSSLPFLTANFCIRSKYSQVLDLEFTSVLTNTISSITTAAPMCEGTLP